MDEHPSNGASQKVSWLERLGQALLGEPRDRDELIDLLRDAERRSLFDADALAMLEAVLQVSDMQVRDIMIPRSQMVVVKWDDSPEEILPVIIESGHSRFPVIGDSRDEIEGILLAKDLLRVFASGDQEKFNMREVLRMAIFVPESKRLNILLKEFRASRNHLAIVVDEYGGVAGMVTIEDVLEQIVGEIEDEHDTEDGTYIYQHSDDIYTVKALTDVEDFNEFFDSKLPEEEFDTIGGLIMSGLGKMPQQGDIYTIDRFQFKIIRADKRRIHLLRLTIIPQDVEEGEEIA